MLFEYDTLGEGSACDTYPCWNEGTCLPGNESRSEYTCQCAPFYSGDHCQIRLLDQCVTHGCKPGMTCRINGIDLHCPLDLFNDFLSNCLTTQCLNGGSCLDHGSGYRCTCVAPFHGPFCQFEGNQSASAWSMLEVGLLCLLSAMILFTIFLICCGNNVGFYVSVPQKRYSRWEEGDISDEEEDQEIALGNMHDPKMRPSKTAETIVDETEPGQTPNAPNAPT
ncbi:unnamed protein product, partial [Mesorhabditis spiculigera]